MFDRAYAVWMERPDGLNWEARMVAVFPASLDDFRALGGDAFVGWSLGRAVVFDRTGVLGMAECVR